MYFVDILAKETDLVSIFQTFQRLEIVSINLIQNQDDPQLIFESLNSTGVDLTDGDLIRNYILMDLEASFQEKLYLDYWLKIENLSGDIAEFVRNFLMFKLSKNVTQTKRAVYNEFKKYAEEIKTKKPSTQSIIGKIIYPKKTSDSTYANVRTEPYVNNGWINNIIDDVYYPNPIGVVQSSKKGDDGKTWYLVKLDNNVSRVRTFGWVRSDVVSTSK